MTIPFILWRLRRFLDDLIGAAIGPPRRLVPIPVRVRVRVRDDERRVLRR